MTSLADLPELVGFFSYSREDDADSHGALSALRTRIQGELRGQLGRTAKTFRLWQDKEAIPSGTLWETEITNAVGQSVFFIPIITPTVVASSYCRFELDAFLAREVVLGRSDLVFPILYIHVPGLEDSVRRQNDAVLSLIAKRQYVDWRDLRHLDSNSTEVKRAIERFCGHIRDALHKPWVSPEERAAQEKAAVLQRAEDDRKREEAEVQRQEQDAKRRAAEVRAREHAEEERRQQAEQEQRRAQEEERRKQDEAEARQRGETERRAREAEAKKRAEQEGAFAAAKRADTLNAIDEFLKAYPDSYLVGEARALRATMVERDRAYVAAIQSNDPAALSGFLERYPAGKLADEVRRQLRPLEPALYWGLSRRALLSAGTALGVGSALAGVTWLELQPGYFLWRSLYDNSIRTFHNEFEVSWAIISSVAFSPDGRTAVSACGGFTSALWDLATAKSRKLRELGSAWSVAFSPDGKMILAGGLYKTLTLLDVATGREIRTFSGHTDTVTSVAFSPDGHTALSGSDDKTLKLWDVATGIEIRTFSGHADKVRSVAFSPDGRTAVSGSDDKTLKLWDVTTGKELRTFMGHSAPIFSVALSPEGRSVLSGSSDQTLKLWDLATGKELRTFTGHTQMVISVAFSPDGRTALSGSQDLTLKLWDVTTGKELRTMTGHSGYVSSVAFSPDGRTALSGSQDNTLKLWNVQ